MLAMRGASSCWRGVGWMAPSGRSDGAAVRPLEPVAASSSAQPPARASGRRILRRELPILDIRGCRSADMATAGAKFDSFAANIAAAPLEMWIQADDFNTLAP